MGILRSGWAVHCLLSELDGRSEVSSLSVLRGAEPLDDSSLLRPLLSGRGLSGVVG